MRCLALAQAWQDGGGNVAFAMAESTPAIDARLRSEGMEIVHLDVSPNSLQDARALAALASGSSSGMGSRGWLSIRFRVSAQPEERRT